MKKTAFVFAGQGAQYSGMGESLCEISPGAKALYQMAESIRPGTIKQSFSGTVEELRQTQNTQPCLYLADLAAALALEERGIKADCCAGFSLGELAALAYAGVYTHEIGFSLVVKRAMYMAQDAAGMAEEAGMAAVIKLDAAVIEQICRETQGVYPVNYNSPGQVAISGTKSGIAAFRVKAAGTGCRIMDIPVSGAFHSPYMDTAAQKLGSAMENVSFAAPRIPVYANSTGTAYGANIADTLAKQVNHPVLWEKSIQTMVAEGVEICIECGPGKTLAGLIKRIHKDMEVYSVQDAETLAAVVEALG